jgi:DNA-binding CsgD family transcriptional regulator
LAVFRVRFEKVRRAANLASAPGASTSECSPGWGLTPREIEVTTWLTQGKSNPEIAIILQMRPRTVEKHVERILDKLGVENRTAAAVLVLGSESA